MCQQKNNIEKNGQWSDRGRLHHHLLHGFLYCELKSVLFCTVPCTLSTYSHPIQIVQQKMLSRHYKHVHTQAANHPIDAIASVCPACPL